MELPRKDHLPCALSKAADLERGAYQLLLDLLLALQIFSGLDLEKGANSLLHHLLVLDQGRYLFLIHNFFRWQLILQLRR